MNIQVKSSNGITTVPIDSQLLLHRKVFVEGEINHDVSWDFVKKIMLLAQEDKKKPINVFINSPGGEITAGMLMYDVIQSSETPIRLYCMGRAYSMAAILFASGNHGRYMFSHSKLMVHEPLLGNHVSGNSSSIKSISDSLLESKKKMNEILAKHTGKTESEIEEATSFDHYFSATESIDFGLCDGIVGINEVMEG